MVGHDHAVAAGGASEVRKAGYAARGWGSFPTAVLRPGIHAADSGACRVDWLADADDQGRTHGGAVVVTALPSVRLVEAIHDLAQRARDD